MVMFKEIKNKRNEAGNGPFLTVSGYPLSVYVGQTTIVF